MNHPYHYNLTGAERKALVEAISMILGITAVYQKAPTFAYQIGVYTVDKTGALLFPEDADPEEVQMLLTKSGSCIRRAAVCNWSIWTMIHIAISCPETWEPYP